MPFKFKKLDIPDVILIEPTFFNDERGVFAETFKLSDFKTAGIKYDFVQDNYSKSKKGVIRGMHYQLDPMAQGKLVRVVHGKIFDAVIDLRKNSPYYCKWVGVILSEENRLMLWVPPGFAHGFLALEDNSEVIYKTTKEYAPGLDRGIIWDDKKIGIKWPIKNPMPSGKDAKLPSFENIENNFEYTS